MFVVSSGDVMLNVAVPPAFARTCNRAYVGPPSAVVIFPSVEVNVRMEPAVAPVIVYRVLVVPSAGTVPARAAGPGPTYVVPLSVSAAGAGRTSIACTVQN